MLKFLHSLATKISFQQSKAQPGGVGAKWAEAPPLAKSKLRKKILCLSNPEVAWFGQLMVLKIVYDTVKLQKVT